MHNDNHDKIRKKSSYGAKSDVVGKTHEMRTGRGDAKKVIIDSENDQFAKTAKINAAKANLRKEEIKSERESKLIGKSKGQNSTLANIAARKQEVAKRFENAKKSEEE